MTIDLNLTEKQVAHYTTQSIINSISVFEETYLYGLDSEDNEEDVTVLLQGMEARYGEDVTLVGKAKELDKVILSNNIKLSTLNRGYYCGYNIYVVPDKINNSKFDNAIYAIACPLKNLKLGKLGQYSKAEFI